MELTEEGRDWVEQPSTPIQMDEIPRKKKKGRRIYIREKKENSQQRRENSKRTEDSTRLHTRKKSKSEKQRMETFQGSSTFFSFFRRHSASKVQSHTGKKRHRKTRPQSELLLHRMKPNHQNNSGESRIKEKIKKKALRRPKRLQQQITPTPERESHADNRNGKKVHPRQKG